MGSAMEQQLTVPDPVPLPKPLILDDRSKATSDPASGGSNSNPVNIVGGFGSLYSLPAKIRACIFGQVYSPSKEHQRYILSYK